MKTFSVAEQVAAHLREELQQGKWTKVMPGRDRLARELNVHGSTIERALGQLEKEGLLESGGAGKRRKIVSKKIAPRATRVIILLYDPEDVLDHRVAEIQKQLHIAGYRANFASKAMSELKHDPKRILAMMKAHPAEAWIVIAGKRSVVESLSNTSTPTFALFGDISGLQVSGARVKRNEAFRDCFDHLYKKGRRRIVMLTRREVHTKELSPLQELFFEELEKRNLSQSSYNLPEWEDTPDGLHRCLDELFKVTPPDAIIVCDWVLSYAIQNFISRRRGLAFRQVECVSIDYHSSFKWCQPAVSHFYWNQSKTTQRIVQWVDRIAQGKEHKKVTLIEAKFIPGG